MFRTVSFTLRIVGLFVATILSAAFIAPSTAAQIEKGFVYGRVCERQSGQPIAGAFVRVQEWRGGRCRIVGRGRSDRDGTFAVKVGASIVAPSLHVTAPGHGFTSRRLRHVPLGGSLVVGDVELDRGASLDVRLADTVLDPVLFRLRIMPLSDDGVVDLDAEPFLTTEITGRTTRLAHVGRGVHAIVIDSPSGRVRPRLVVWNMSRHATTLPPVDLVAGDRLNAVFVSRNDTAPDVTVTVGAGIWPQDSGPEYRFRFDASVDKIGPTRYRLGSGPLPGAAMRLLARAGRDVFELDTVHPTIFDDDLIPERGAEFTGRIIDRASARPIGGAAVLVDGRRVVTAVDGSFRVVGLAPGGHRVDVGAIGYAPIRDSILVTAATREIVRRDLRLTPNATPRRTHGRDRRKSGRRGRHRCRFGSR